MQHIIPIAALAMLSLGQPGAAGEADAWIAAAREAAEPYRDFTVAKREGWRSFGGDEPLMGQHFFRPDGPDYVSGQSIDPRRPSNLLYTTVRGERRLVALSYNVRIAPGEPMPEGFPGRADVWHVHDAVDFLNAASRDRPILGWLARGWLNRNIVRKDGKTRLAMVHLWLIPNPDGVFASHNRRLAYQDLGLPEAWADGADMKAARGLALASANGCDEALDGRLWIANVERDTAATLKSACGQIADWVRKGLDRGRAHVNQRGRNAWDAFEEQMELRLSHDQKARIAAISEHGRHE